MGKTEKYNNLRESIQRFELNNDYFITLINRPKRANGVAKFLGRSTFENIGVILQGPVVREEDFTVETCNMYSKIFPGAKIILSTWNDEDSAYLETKLNPEINVLLNKKPDDPGFHNLNFQLISTRKGIEFAENHACKSVLKTRTDQRIYNPDALGLMESIMELYPVNSDKQKGRIILIDQVSKKFIPYFYSDLLQFGFVSDIKRYWRTDDDAREVSDECVSSKLIRDLFYRSNSCHIARNYLVRTFGVLNNTIRQSCEILRDYFYVMGKSDLDLYWFQSCPSVDKNFKAYRINDPKRGFDRSQQRLQEYREKNYGQKILLRPFTQTDWILMRSKGVQYILPDFEYSDIMDLDRLHSFDL